MKSQCLPFSQIPHSTRLFTDFLSYSGRVQRFYPHSPHFAEWFEEEASHLQYDVSRRARVADALERQNRAFGAAPKTFENIARFRAGAFAAVTGQQVGLFGGPVFSLYKALTAVKLAEQASSAGVDCVPVFWLATVDHDLAEINHVSMLGPDASLQVLSTPTRSLPDAPVGAIEFGSEIQPVVDAAAQYLGDTEPASLLRECYRPGETFGRAFARLFAHLFAQWGVVLLDAADSELNAIAEPIYRSAIERAAELDEALLGRGRELESSGYHQQVKVTPSSTLLFALRNGARVPVHRQTNGNTSQSNVVVGGEQISQQELLRQIASTPQEFSPNVLLRPVVQDYLLPTIAYTGGSAEVAYFAQAEVVYAALLGRVTPIIPRFSATLLESKPRTLLDKYGVSLQDTFSGPDSLRERLAAQTLPQDLQLAFEEAGNSLQRSLVSVREALEKLDKTLLEASNNAGSKMQHQLDQLRARAARAELRQSEILGRHAHVLSQALYPGKTLQEREIGGIYFLSRHGSGLLRQLYDAMQTDCLDHQVIALQA